MLHNGRVTYAAKPLRSQGTRDRILQEARRLFAEQGFDHTTIRAVAQAAQINASMVMRYYGSKEELFAAAATFQFHMPDLRVLPAKNRGVALVAHILDQWEGPTAGEELQVLLRAAGTHEQARKRLVSLVEEQAVPVISAVLPAKDHDERLGLILVQLAGLVLSRYFLKYAAVLALDRDAVIREVGAAVQNQLSVRREK